MACYRDSIAFPEVKAEALLCCVKDSDLGHSVS
jgi:hypothetical protein